MLHTDAEEIKAGLTGMTLARFGRESSRNAVNPQALGAIQAKSAINTPGDDYEQEADRVSEPVMRMPEQPLQRACACAGSSPRCRSQTEQPRQNTERLQTKHVRESDADDVSEAPSDVDEEVQKAVDGGAPMPEPLRDFFEPRFGHNFSQVRIHTGQMAESASQSLRAVAFTFGSNIFFNSGQYRTNTGSGLGLLAHELAHVIQQKAGSVSRRLIQRALIPYRQITWADFLATPPKTPTSLEGAEIVTKFDLMPTYSPVTTVKRTGKKCRVGRTRSTEVEATSAPDPADFKKPEAQMDQDTSWALDRYTGNGTNFCTGVATKCERDFDNAPTVAGSTCRQAANGCSDAFKQGQKSFGQYFNNTPVMVTREADCMTTFFSKCQQLLVKGFTVTDRGATARTKADCKGPFFQRCLVNEGVERARLLKHEQGHFDITNVMAKNARESGSLKAASLPVKKTGCGEDAARDAARQEYNTNVRDVLIQLGRAWISSRDRAQTDYDNETGNGAKAAEQTAWEAKIKAGLKDYYPTTAPAPAAAPATPSPAPTPRPRP